MAVSEIGTKGDQDTLHEFEHSGIADQPWELSSEKTADKPRVVSLKVPVSRLMERDNYRHHFADRKARGLVSLLGTRRNKVLLPCWKECLTEVVDIHKNSV